jgi:hypothetical protein
MIPSLSGPTPRAAELSRQAALEQHLMGSWGVGTFDNDAACDWATKLEAAQDLSAVRQAIGRALSVGDAYLDANVACEALAACEVIARLKDNWGPLNPYTKRIDSWVASHHVTPQLGLVQAAVSPIDRVLAQPSELLELWSEGDDYENWLESVRDLRNRVRA